LTCPRIRRILHFAVAASTGATHLSSYATTEGELTIRRPYRAAPTVKEGPRINDEIRIPQVQLVDTEGVNHGIVDIEEARHLADEAGLDLVEISPNSQPPVVKILDYGKYKFQAQKKANEARKKQKTVEVKEIKMRPSIDTHDYDTKMKAARRFLDEGDKVKMTLRFRGREMAHQELGLQLLFRVRDDLAQEAKVESEPRLEGRQMIMILAPSLKAVSRPQPAAAPAPAPAVRVARTA
jgi:translation initiation factor IF-3